MIQYYVIILLHSFPLYNAILLQSKINKIWSIYYLEKIFKHYVWEIETNF